MKLRTQNRLTSGAKKFAIDPYWVAYLIFTFVITGLYISQLDDTMGWGDDWGAYLNGARKFLQGRPVNEGNLVTHGASGYPILLSITASLLSWSFADLKIVQSLSIGLWGITIFGLARYFVSRQVAFLVASVCITFPFLLPFQHELYSDLPGAALVYAALWSFLAATRMPQRKIRYIMPLLVGVLLLLALMMRPPASMAAIAVLAAGLGCIFLRSANKKDRLYLIMICASTASAFLFYKLYWPSVPSNFVQTALPYYQNFIRQGLSFQEILWRQGIRELNHFAILYFFRFPPLTWGAALLVLGAIVSTGIWLRQIRNLSVLLFFWGSAFLLWLTPWDADSRYQLSISPLLLMAGAAGFEFILRRYLRTKLVVPFLLAVMVGNNIYTSVTHLWNQPGFPTDPIHRSDVLQIAAWFRTHSQPGDVICGPHKPRIFMYLADRPVCAITASIFAKDQHSARDFLRSRAHAKDAKYLLVAKDASLFYQGDIDGDLVSRIIEKLRSDPSVTLKYDGLSFQVYEVMP